MSFLRHFKHVHHARLFSVSMQPIASAASKEMKKTRLGEVDTIKGKSLSTVWKGENNVEGYGGRHHEDIGHPL